MSDILNADAQGTTDASQSADTGTDASKTDNQSADGDKSQNSDNKADPAPWLEKDGSDKADKKADSDADKKADASDGKKDEGDKDKKPDGEDGESDKDQTDKKDDQGAPEEYADFKLAEGMQVNDEALTDFKALSRELNLTQDQAQKFIDLQSKIETARIEAFANEVKEWDKQSRTDKEFGGAGFEANVAAANSALAKFGSPELITLLRNSGYSNHPEVIRCFVKIGNALKEGGTKRQTSQTSGKKQLKDIYD